MRITPATLAFDDTGTPFSPAYGDRYHSAASGPGQARHVFLGGNGIPARWQGQRLFTVLETGFGLGTNFFATWQAWRDHDHRPRRLHYVSIEKHPFDTAALARAHAAHPAWQSLSAQLLTQWPPLVPGIYRLVFENGGVVLTLALMDVEDAADALRLRADAYFLDGFAPDRNPAMWSDRVIRRLARMANPDATAATWSTSAATRGTLAQAGFHVERAAGFPPKRHMTVARYAPPWRVAEPPSAMPGEHAREVLVIGAGLAGTSVADSLVRRGWRVALIDAGSGPGCGASSLASVFRVHVSPDDAPLSRLTRACAHLLSHRQQAHLHRCGVALLSEDDAEYERMQRAVDNLTLPQDYAATMDADRLSALTGMPVARGGLWLPGGGHADAGALMQSMIGNAGTSLSLRFGRRVASLAREEGRWVARLANGELIASAPFAVLANATEALQFASIDHPLARTRGQIATLPATTVRELRAVVAGNGYVTPATDAGATAGATHDDDAAGATSESSHREIAARVSNMIPSLRDTLKNVPAAGSVAFRCVTPDHLPVIGAMPDIDAASALGASLPGIALSKLPRVDGLYGAFGFGSRGLLWGPMSGEVIAALLEGEPLPVEAALAHAIDPGRFLLRNARRRVAAQ